MNKVYIILLNYNGWKDTIECLESVFKNDYQNYQVILVDNKSTDDSQKKIIDWLEGKQKVIYSEDSNLKYLSQPFENKPLTYKIYTETDSENIKKTGKDSSTVIFINAESNRGFAAGNNIGIKYALIQNDFSYVWLLNNDTVIKPDALSELLKKADEHNAGITGSTLMYYHEPDKIQALGSYVNKFFAMPRVILNKDDIEKKLEYIVGASFLISKKLIDKIGLLPEEYFMYYEETDYCYTAGKHNFNITVALNSIVYHKEGAAMKEKDNNGSALADYLALRNKIIFAKKHLPKYLIFVYLSFIGVLINRIRRRNLFKLLAQKNNVKKLLNFQE